MSYYFFFSLLFFGWYIPYTHKNKKNEDSYSYEHDNKNAKDSFVLYIPYTLFLPVKDGQVEVARLIPCIKKDPTLVRIF